MTVMARMWHQLLPTATPPVIIAMIQGVPLVVQKVMS